jgi:hypothetical protein
MFVELLAIQEEEFQIDVRFEQQKFLLDAIQFCHALLEQLR